MRVLVISDLHANLQATEAVLADASRHGWESALVLGDLVGYGADPAAVVDAVRGLAGATVIRGNHDKVVAGIDNASDFNFVARQAAEWTIDALDDDRAAYLRALPRGPVTISTLGLDLAICHGAPFDEDYYLFDADDAGRAFETSEAALVFCGHTHVQIAFRQTAAGGARALADLDAGMVEVGSNVRTLVNPGSVGQPRDGDPRAAYGILDTAGGVVHLHRVAYDIGEAQRRIIDAGLHASLAERLLVGR